MKKNLSENVIIKLISMIKLVLIYEKKFIRKCDNKIDKYDKISINIFLDLI